MSGNDVWHFQIQQPIYGKEDGEFGDYLAPGIIISLIAVMVMLSCAMSFIAEKNDGMVHRTKVAGVTIFEIMMSHCIPQFGVIVIQTACAFLIMFVLFDTPSEGSITLAFFLVVCHGLSGIVLGETP